MIFALLLMLRSYYFCLFFFPCKGFWSIKNVFCKKKKNSLWHYFPAFKDLDLSIPNLGKTPPGWWCCTYEATSSNYLIVSPIQQFLTLSSSKRQFKNVCKCFFWVSQKLHVKLDCLHLDLLNPTLVESTQVVVVWYCFLLTLIADTWRVIGTILWCGFLSVTERFRIHAFWKLRWT